MSKLIHANLSRLRRDKIFWIVVVFMLGLSAINAINDGIQALQYGSDDIVERLNDHYFNLLPMISIFCSVFVSLFLGTEYSDGTIRNKIMIGHSRTDVYLSNYIVCLAGNMTIYIAMLIGSAVGVHYFGMWQGTAGEFIAFVLTGVFITVSITAILTMLSMLSTNKAVTAVFSIVLSIALMMLGSSLYNILQEPETTRSFLSMTAEGVVEFGDVIPNPAYVSGWKRTLYQFIIELLPQGHGILLCNGEIRFPIYIIYSFIITVILNAAGIFAFRKKDLK